MSAQRDGSFRGRVRGGGASVNVARERRGNLVIRLPSECALMYTLVYADQTISEGGLLTSMLHTYGIVMLSRG